MLYFKRHIFFCLNQRDHGEDCCGKYSDAQAAFEYCKQKIHSLSLSGAGKVRVSKSGCLDRCAGGPVCVVYPEGVWYSYVDNADIDEIVHSHLENGKYVQRLILPPTVGR